MSSKNLSTLHSVLLDGCSFFFYPFLLHFTAAGCPLERIKPIDSKLGGGNGVIAHSTSGQVDICSPESAHWL